jgi:hypothetical protein
MPGKTHIRILKSLLVVTAVWMILTWLPLIRGLFDGPSYEWGVSFFGRSFGGAGLSSDAWVLVLQMLLGGGILYLGYRGPRQPFHGLILIWLGFHAANFLYSSLTDPEALMFHGDTLGVHVNLGYGVVAVFGAFFVLALAWVWRDLKTKPAWPKAVWTGRNRALWWVAGALLPIQFVLLRFGEPHGLTDQVGVMLTMAQWAVVQGALYPWGAWKVR